MSRRTLLPGKLPAQLLEELLGEFADWPPELLLGPAPGEDACAIRIGDGVLVAATDPITFTGRQVGGHAVWINANDVAVMGVRPRWFLASILLPRGSEQEDVRGLFAHLRTCCDQVGVTLVGGHTEVTASVAQPVVVGTMLGFSEGGGFLSTGGVRSGDRIVQVGGAPVEGAAVLSAEAGARLGDLEPAVLERARGALEDPGISVVEAALHSAELGATALHDPTEGGLAAGLCELANASGLALEVDPDAVLWFEPGRRICEVLGADPWATLASGTLLASFPPDVVSAALLELGSRGMAASEIGVARSGHGVRLEGGGDLSLPARDEVARVLGGVR